MSYQKLLEEMQAENEFLETNPCADVVRFVHLKAPDNAAGIDGRPLLAWFFACPDARYIAAYSYQILRLEREADASLDQLRIMFRNFMIQPAEFIGYCGLRTVWDYTQRICALLDDLTREELVALVVEMHMYGSHLNAWIHHYFPWGIGYAYQPNSLSYAQEITAALDPANAA